MKTFSKVLVFIVLLISGCSQTSTKGSKDFTEIVGDISVSSIEVTDGRSGKQYSITEKEKIQNFNKLLNGKKYKKIKNPENVKGYIYNAVLYSGKKENYITFLDNEIKIDDTYYSLDKPISVQDISNILK